MVEDESSKLRRNLVAFCAAYLIGWYLDISVQEILNHLNFAKGAGYIPAHKLMVVSSLVFSYLAWRWFTCDEQKKYYSEFLKIFDIKVFDLSNDWIFKRVNDRKFDKYLDFINTEQRTKFLDWESDLDRRIAPGWPMEISIHSYQRGKFSGVWLLSLMVVKPNQNFPRTDINFKVSLPVVVRISFGARAFYHVLLKAPFWEWVPPILLSALTLICIMYRAIAYAIAPQQLNSIIQSQSA
jgi:hypothetical protein